MDINLRAFYHTRSPLPGHYVLEVRGVVNGEVVTDTEKFIFSVDVPWYMGGYAALCYLLIFIAFVVGLINWRSRLKGQNQQNTQITNCTENKPVASSKQNPPNQQ